MAVRAHRNASYPPAGATRTPRPLLACARDVRASAVSPEGSALGARDPGPGRAGQGLRGRGDRGAARGRREGPPAHPVEVQPAMVRRHAEVLQLVRSAQPEGSQRLPDVRSPDGRAAPLRGGPVRAARLAIPIAVLALTVAGC